MLTQCWHSIMLTPTLPLRASLCKRLWLQASKRPVTNQQHMRWGHTLCVFRDEKHQDMLVWAECVHQTWKNTKSLHNLNSIYFSYTGLFLGFTKEIAGKIKKFTQIWKNLHKHGLQVCAFFHVWFKQDPSILQELALSFKQGPDFCLQFSF